MKLKNEYKTCFVTFHSEYIYLQMNQGLKGAFLHYLQFSDILFGHLSKNQKSTTQITFIRDFND